MGDIVQWVEHLPRIYKILGSIFSNTKGGGDNYNKVTINFKESLYGSQAKEDIQDKTG